MNQVTEQTRVNYFSRNTSSNSEAHVRELALVKAQKNIKANKKERKKKDSVHNGK